MWVEFHSLKRRINIATRKEKADIVIKNGTIINVFTRELMTGDIAIADGVIVGIGQFEGYNEIDASGYYISPGFIDGHVHIESAMVTPIEYAKTVLPHGVTAVIADPHEIANVAGQKGIQFMLDSSENLPFDVYIMLPSSVPATKFENSGARLEIEQLSPFFNHPRVLGLAEVMNYPALRDLDESLLQKIVNTLHHGGKIDGHAAGLGVDAINAYMTAMIRTDHEAVSIEEAKVRLERGMYLLIRQGTAAKDVQQLIPIVNDHNARRCVFVTDDKHLDDLMAEGSVDYNIRLAIQNGIQPITAIQMATINVAECFGLKQQGAIAPGYKADLVFISDLEKIMIDKVFKNGELVAENGTILHHMFHKAEQHVTHLLGDYDWKPVFDSVNIQPITKEQLTLSIQNNTHVNVIGIIPNQIITEHLVEQVDIEDGFFIPSTVRDQLKIAVIERHHRTGNIGLGVVKGLGFTSGAIATTVAHDSHNIIVAGTNDEDMLEAIRVIEKNKGGLVVIDSGKQLAFLPLSIAGLLSIKTNIEVVHELEQLHHALQKIGAKGHFNPFLTLSFLALPVIPHLKITDMGLFDVKRFRHIKLDEK